ncbi:hypothetical protein BDA96_06G045000 [Sorghum bicolor]|uniref:Uncharacterized protein n=2 Tax=Sorghum bicolor TaxID=4558 RepID=A0A921UBF2_SORBI|nr:hypothetical protein BDA96_06G045000 [Sorghum bicolor]KXG26012.1 hypothetical protein SORBI_3006G041200 [Sorghum bicolor]
MLPPPTTAVQRPRHPHACLPWRGSACCDCLTSPLPQPTATTPTLPPCHRRLTSVLPPTHPCHGGSGLLSPPTVDRRLGTRLPP